MGILIFSHLGSISISHCPQCGGVCTSLNDKESALGPDPSLSPCIFPLPNCSFSAPSSRTEPCANSFGKLPSLPCLSVVTFLFSAVCHFLPWAQSWGTFPRYKPPSALITMVTMPLPAPLLFKFTPIFLSVQSQRFWEAETSSYSVLMSRCPAWALAPRFCLINTC